MTAINKDKLISQIPSHILEEHPRFFDFLEGYYEWLNQDGNAYERIKNHMDYLSFKKSLDDYVSHMRYEYLSDVPENVLLDKELFIKWSRKFNLARGSHASYKFLFKVLFDDQNVELYLPKENILRTDDGVWISGESILLTTNSGNQNLFEFQRVFQKRELYPGVVEKASAIVQRVKTKYSGRYNITELTISNVIGEFKRDWPLETVTGGYEWMIPTIESFDIEDGGSEFTPSQRLQLDGLSTFTISRTAETDNEFDTRITSFLTQPDIGVVVDSVAVTNFTYDGRIVSAPEIDVGSTVEVTFPVYEGYVVVDEIIEDTGAVESIEILDPVIGSQDGIGLTWSNRGSGLVASSVGGYIKPVKPFYEGTKGFIDSNMYFQDDSFYQNYSYVIRTQQDFERYRDIVERVIHPGGFLMFGEVSILQLIELLLEYKEERITTPRDDSILHKYGIGANYTFFDKLKSGVSKRLYRVTHFDDMLDYDYVVGDPNYSLESERLAGLPEYEYAAKKGWMHPSNLSDYYLYIPNPYIEYPDSGDTYFETGYISDRDETV